MEKQPATYILASGRNGTLYVGVTSNLIARFWQHKQRAVAGFTQDHEIDCLVWYESHTTMEAAIVHEKRLKRWNREWKLRLIEERNPYWRDLWPELTS